MNILIGGYGQYDVFAPAWCRALSELGHHVTFFDFQEYTQRGLIGRIKNRTMWRVGLQNLNRSLLEKVRQHRPDVTLIHNGNNIKVKTIQALKEHTWIAGYQHDDPFGAFSNRPHFRNFRKTIPFYESHHVVRPENIQEYQQLGVTNVRLLNRYYTSWVHYLKNNTEKDLDVIFIGHAERDNRLNYIKYLVEHGVPLTVFCSPDLWQKYLGKNITKKLKPLQPVKGNCYANTIARAKICLAFYSKANRDRDAYRVFEVPACGGFLLAERTDIMNEFYVEGKEAEFFDSPEELVEKIDFYLSHVSQRESIARCGYCRATKSGYDIISRMRQWVQDTIYFKERMY